MAHFNALLKLLDPIERSIGLPLTDMCSQARHYDQDPELLVSVCSVYYLSRLLLHASMVPVLSGCPVESPSAMEFVRVNASIVLEQALAFEKLLEQLIAHDLDVTRLWHFSGYGAFVTGTVFIVSRSCHKHCSYHNTSVIFKTSCNQILWHLGGNLATRSLKCVAGLLKIVHSVFTDL